MTNNWNEYRDLLFKATENTDKTIYKMFLDRKKPNNNIKLEAQPVKSHFDILQKTDNSKDVLEIKVRHKYPYEQFDDIAIDVYKLNYIQTIQEEIGATNSYIVAVYPQSDKIILVDVTYINYDEDNVIQLNANHYTLTEHQEKILKPFIQLNIKDNDKIQNTKTYKYSFPNLKDTYISTFKKYCKKYEIPEDIMKKAIRDFY